MTRKQGSSLVMSDMVKETVADPVPDKGVQVTEVRSSETAMIPGSFL